MEDKKYTLAIIKANPTKFDRENHHLIEEIDQYIEIKPVKHSNLVQMIADATGMVPEKIQGESTICYQDDRFVYDLCFVDPESNHIPYTDDDLNCISSHLSLQNIKIYNTCVLLKSRIDNQQLSDPTEITLDDIKRLLRAKVVHKGIRLGVDDKEPDEFTFYMDPLEDVKEEDLPDYGCIESPFLKFNFIVYFNINTMEVVSTNMRPGWSVRRYLVRFCSSRNQPKSYTRI